MGNAETSSGDLPDAPKGLRSGLWVRVPLSTEAAEDPRPERSVPSRQNCAAGLGAPQEARAGRPPGLLGKPGRG